ncbi:exonuclease [Synechococcus phage ACG-2014e]|jgi:genome maintenance exonuclease 1|uniref:Exonuclease n=1 Tax=Synechococcus phage ACG-2014e TaxID=1493510 RepID=A0A0E3HAX0_9CAUD|nr:exonuclease [Synechococcus phage ACG-2014e]YP_010355827.1 exonuclease [Synechococcus phage ACG-2014e]AIX20678.1 exonuclease [Synechococcus phage ACG-2014e]AIX29893.1 exonuclease [Synechococcus phage ACG-2014e]AIX45130.1 exonuclease [Synechococcus phage ACG-2014e]
MKLFNHVGLDPIEMSAEMVGGKRVYLTPTGHHYPSVTTVIGNNAAKKAGIAKWRARVGEKAANAKTTRATGRGTKYHSIAEDYFNNNLDLKKYKSHPLPVLMFHHSRPTLDRINNIYLQEAALYSKHLEIAGRVDCIAEFDGVLSIIDFKTAAEPKREKYLYDYFVQETAYACMLQENYGLSVKQLVTIVACENGETQVKVLPPKKEFFMKLMSYISEYQEQHGQETIIRG